MSVVNPTRHRDLRGLFAGPSVETIDRAARRIGLAPGADPRVIRRALQYCGLAWLPLFALVIIQSASSGSSVLRSFLTDYSVHARFLVALPLLTLCARGCALRLESITANLLHSGQIVDEDLPRFDAAVASTRRLRDSKAALLAIVAMAFGIVISFAVTLSASDLPGWHFSGNRMSLAGYWHRWISLPLLLMLLLGWFWRYVRWWRFLWLVSRLDLRLLAAHPDRSGGLAYLAHSLRDWAPLAAALAAMLAGTMVNEVLLRGGSLVTFQLAAASLVISAVVLGSAPLLVMTPKLMECWHRGMLEYGALAEAVGRKFEKAWVARRDCIGEEALETQAFSATTDLYGVVANVYAMRIILFDGKSLAMLVAAALLPFVPAALAVAPLDAMLATVANILL
jgi:hypothetical protein